MPLRAPARHAVLPGVHHRSHHQGRLASLIPIRVGRMVASPYGLLRGATVVMTNDSRGCGRVG
jgi:hypothetical protein